MNLPAASHVTGAVRIAVVIARAGASVAEVICSPHGAQAQSVHAESRTRVPSQRPSLSNAASGVYSPCSRRRKAATGGSTSSAQRRLVRRASRRSSNTTYPCSCVSCPERTRRSCSLTPAAAAAQSADATVCSRGAASSTRPRLLGRLFDLEIRGGRICSGACARARERRRSAQHHRSGQGAHRELGNPIRPRPPRHCRLRSR